MRLELLPNCNRPEPRFWAQWPSRDPHVQPTYTLPTSNCRVLRNSITAAYGRLRLLLALLATVGLRVKGFHDVAAVSDTVKWLFIRFYLFQNDWILSHPPTPVYSYYLPWGLCHRHGRFLALVALGYENTLVQASVQLLSSALRQPNHLFTSHMCLMCVCLFWPCRWRRGRGPRSRSDTPFSNVVGQAKCQAALRDRFSSS